MPSRFIIFWSDWRGMPSFSAARVLLPVSRIASCSMRRFSASTAVLRSAPKDSPVSPIGSGADGVGAARERGDALDLVLELAHVAWPRVAGQPIHRGVGEALELATHAAARAVEEGVREHGDVLAPLAHRRHVDLHHAQPVVEVL